MRTDIKCDYENFDILFSHSIPQYTLNLEWVKEDDYNIYGTCVINNLLSININTGIGVNIPFLSVKKKVFISFLIEDGYGNTGYMLNRKNNQEYFPLLNLQGEQIYSTYFPILSVSGQYRIIINNNNAYICDYRELDLSVIESLEQNKMFLLQCTPGNLYQFPTTGVSIFKYLNSNLSTSGLGEKIKEQFNLDNMYVEKAIIDQETGNIQINAKEL